MLKNDCCPIISHLFCILLLFAHLKMILDIRSICKGFSLFSSRRAANQPFNLLTLLGSNGRKQGTTMKIYSAMRTMPVWFRATEIKKTRGSESVRKAGLSVDNSASPQTIPPKVLMDESRTLSFINPFRSHPPGIVLISESISK